MATRKLLDSVPNLAGNILVVAVGQGGANIGMEFQRLGYIVYYVNTSKKDLDSLEDVDDDYKYHIAGATGCNKDREKAKRYGQKSYRHIVKDIIDRFGMFTHILFTFSMGGASGSGLTPMLIRAFGAIAPDKVLLTLGAVSSLSESPKARANSVTCYNDLTLLKNISNQYWIDNSMFDTAEEMLEHNEVIASTMHEIFNMSSTDNRGNIDDNEVKGLLEVSGTVAIATVSKKQKLNGKRLLLDKHFISSKGRASYVAFSITDDSDFIVDEIGEKYGEQEDRLKAFKTEGESFIVIFGLPMPKLHFDELKDSYEEFKLEQEEQEEVVNEKIKIDLVETVSSKRKQQIDIEESLDDIFKDLF